MGNSLVGLVEIRDRLHRAVLAHNDDDAAVYVGSRERHLQHTVRVNCGHHDAEVDAAVLRVGPAGGEALFEELDLAVLTEDAFGDELGDINVETNKLALLVDEAERRCLTRDANDHPAAGAHLIELGSACSGGRLAARGHGRLRHD